jgi:hypothetical protein
MAWYAALRTRGALQVCRLTNVNFIRCQQTLFRGVATTLVFAKSVVVHHGEAATAEGNQVFLDGEPQDPVGHRAMDDHPTTGRDGNAQTFVWNAAADQAIREGVKRGREVLRATIRRFLDSHPSLTRSEIQKRVRKLKNTAKQPRYKRAEWTSELDEILRKGYEQGWSGKRWATTEILKRRPEWPRHAIWRRAIKLGLRHRSPTQASPRKALRWSSNEDRTLLDHAGYDRAATIGKLLNRSGHAVQCRLSQLGATSRVSDGYTVYDLAALLHRSPKVVRRWIMLGWLNVRNPRVSRASLDAFIESHSGLLGLETPKSILGEGQNSTGEYTPNKIASLLGVSRETVMGWIEQRWMKFSDYHITDRSLEDFCKKHGSEIRYDLMPKDALQWLEDSFGVSLSTVGEPGYDGRAFAKHTSKLRKCKGCRREIRGNSYFKHVKRCPRLAALERARDDTDGAHFGSFTRGGPP